MSVVKRNVLTIKQKMDILKDLETASITQVAVAYKIGIRTVFRIKKEAANIAQAAESANSTEIIRKSKPRFPELEEQLYSWFVERRTLGDKLSDALLLEKARELQDGIESNPSSKVSLGWLQRFKKRKNISLVYLHGGIKALPSKTLARNEELNSSDSKEKKERVSVALCANATGTHKLKPFFIHKCKKPKALRNGTGQLPVIYASQENYLTTCHEEERNQNKNEWRDEGTTVTQRTGGFPLNTQERQRVERIFTELEEFNDRASPELQLLLKTFKLMYLGTTSI